MKKTIITTAAALALSFTATTASAQSSSSGNRPSAPPPPASDPVELKVGGFMTWYATYADQRKSTTLGLIDNAGVATPYRIGRYNTFDIMGNAEIYFSGTTTLDNGLKIGAMVQLEAGTDADTWSKVIDESYMTVDSVIGRVIVGNVKNVSNQMAITAPDVSTIGLQETDFTRMVAVPNGFNFLWDATYATWDDTSTKLSYITPTFAGFTAGVSLMPGNRMLGTDADNLLISETYGIRDFKNGIVSVALYEADMGAVKLATSLSYGTYKPLRVALGPFEYGQVGSSNIQDYAAGLNIGIGNFTIGGSYRYVDTKREDRNLGGYVWDAGVSFTAGPVETSVNFIQARNNNTTANVTRVLKDEFNLFQVAGKYKMGAGIDTFINIGYVEYQSATHLNTNSNRGVAVATGMNLSF